MHVWVDHKGKCKSPIISLARNQTTELVTSEINLGYTLPDLIFLAIELYFFSLSRSQTHTHTHTHIPQVIFYFTESGSNPTSCFKIFSHWIISWTVSLLIKYSYSPWVIVLHSISPSPHMQLIFQLELLMISLCNENICFSCWRNTVSKY